MNEIVNKFLLAGDEVMPEMQLNSQDLLLKHSLKTNKEWKKLKEIGDSRYIYQNKLDKAYSQHDMAYVDWKDVPRRTAADEVLRGKVFNTAKNPKYGEYQYVLDSILKKFFIKSLLRLLINLLPVMLLKEKFCQTNN